MLEIFGIYLFCKNLGKRLRALGVAPFWWQFLTVVFWFVGEFIGAVIATIVELLAGHTRPLGGGPYIGAILGALLGGVAAFQMAVRITKKNLATEVPPAFPVELLPPNQ